MARDVTRVAARERYLERQFETREGSVQHGLKFDESRNGKRGTQERMKVLTVKNVYRFDDFSG